MAAGGVLGESQLQELLDAMQGLAGGSSRCGNKKMLPLVLVATCSSHSCSGRVCVEKGRWCWLLLAIPCG